MIRPASIGDSISLAHLYNHYILHSHATFEEIAVTPGEIAIRINLSLSDHLPWLLIEDDSKLLGFARMVKWRGRTAYRHTLESSIYIAPSHTHQGLGTLLYQSLINQSVTHDVHAIIAAIALPNHPSQRLHKKLGYKKVAHLREVGWKFNRWIDVEYWQLIT